MEIVIQRSADAAIEFVTQIIAREIRGNPRCVLGLATGRTMEPVYARLAQLHGNDGLDFSACRTFNLDEYVGLAADNKHSYRHYMNQHLFDKVNIAFDNTHLPDGVAANLADEGKRYERLLAQAGGIDLQLLGIGLSGHIGFNEPLSALSSRTRVVELAPETIEQNAQLFGGAHNMPRQAITMGVGTILDCRRCILLATGYEKSEIIAEAVKGPITHMVPASALQLHSNCTVVLDDPAAALLGRISNYV